MKVCFHQHLCLCLCLSLSLSLSLRFNGHFPGEPELAGYNGAMDMEVVVTTGFIGCAKL